MKKMNISAFVKKDITFEEKLQIISYWEEDRASDGEFVYDLDDDDDAWHWKELYDLQTLYKCRAEGRYWLGGWQFGCNGLNTKGNCSTAWCITEEKMKTFFPDILGEIDDRFEDWMIANDDYDKETAVKDFTDIYGGLINFKAYLNANNPTKYMWVAISDDASFCEHSYHFDQKIDCYNHCLSHFTTKIQWNVEYNDFTDDEETIGYRLRIGRTAMLHKSYSGTYLYKIIPSTEFADTKEFWENLRNEITEYKFD